MFAVLLEIEAEDRQGGRPRALAAANERPLVDFAFVDLRQQEPRVGADRHAPHTQRGQGSQAVVAPHDDKSRFTSPIHEKRTADEGASISPRSIPVVPYLLVQANGPMVFGLDELVRRRAAETRSPDLSMSVRLVQDERTPRIREERDFTGVR